MRPLYTKFSLVFLFFLLCISNSPIAMVSVVEKDLTTKDKTKEITNPTKPRSEIGGKNDRSKKDETFPSPTKTKRKVIQIPPTILNEDIKNPSFTPLILLGKGLQPIKTNFNKETNYNKIVGPDPFRFTISSNKDSVAVGEEIELTITVDWVDYGVNNGVRFLPEWYKYTLRVVTPKGFLQTGGDYTDFCTKPVDANNPQAVFTIKGKFEYTPDEAKFMVLRGFEGSTVESEFIYKEIKEIKIKPYLDFHQGIDNSSKGSRVAQTENGVTIEVTKQEKCGSEIRKIHVRLFNANANSVKVSLYWHHSGTSSCSYTNFAGSPGIQKTLRANVDTVVVFERQGVNALHLDAGYQLDASLSTYNTFNCQLFFAGTIVDLNTTPTITTTNQTCSVKLTTNSDSYVSTASNSSSRIAAGETYSWKRGTTEVGTSQDYYATQTGSYTVTVTKDGCSLTSAPVVVNTIPGVSKPTNLSATKNASDYSLSGTCATGTIKWYSDSNGTTAVTPPVNPTVSTTYYARCENGSCNSSIESVGISICPATPPTSTTVSPSSVVSGVSTEITLGGNCAVGTLVWKKSDEINWYSTSTKASISNSTTFNFRCVYSDVCSSGNGPNQTVVNACSNSALGVGLSITDASCNSSDGVIVAGGRDGVSPYQYKNGVNGTYSSSSTFSGLSVGSYKIFVRDNNGCVASDDGIVNALGGPSSPSPFAGDSKISSATITVTASCANGTITWFRNSSGGTSIGTGGSFSEFITATTDYYVSCNTSGCASGREKVTAIISPDPCASMSVSATNNSGNFNEGDGTNLVLETPDCSGCTFVWTGPNGYYSTNRSSLITNPTWSTHNGVYTVTVSKAGCNNLSDNTTVTLGEPLVNPQIINETLNNVTSFCGQGTYSVRATGCQNNNNVQWWINGNIDNNYHGSGYGGNITVYTSVEMQCRSSANNSLIGPKKQFNFTVAPYQSCFDGNNIIINKTPGGKTAFCTKGWIELYAQGCPDNNQISWYSNNPEINGGRFASVIRGTITQTTTIGYSCIDPTDNTREFSYKQITFTVGAAGCSSPTPTLINNTTHQYDKFCGKGWVNLEVNGCPDNSKAKWYKNNAFVKEGVTYSEVINQTANYKVTCANGNLTAPNYAEIVMQVFDFIDCTIPSAVNLTPDGQTEFCGSGALKLMMSGCGSSGGALYEEHLDDGAYSTQGTANNAGFINDSRLAWEMIDGRNRLVLNYTALKSGYFKVFCFETNGQPKWNTVQKVYFKVNQNPTVSAINTPTCVNNQFNLNAEIVTDIPNNIGDVKYTWTDASGQFVSGSQNPSVLAINATPTTYNVKFTDIKGCTATASTMVTNFALPVVTVQPTFNVCQGSVINLNATSTVGSGKVKVNFNLAENTGLTDRTIILNVSGTPTPATSTVTIIQKAKSATCVKCGTNTFMDGQVFGNQAGQIGHKATIKIENGCAKAWWVITTLNDGQVGLINQDFIGGISNLTIPNAVLTSCLTWGGGTYNNCTNNTRCDIGTITDNTNFTSAGGAGSFEINLPSINSSWSVTKADPLAPITFSGNSTVSSPGATVAYRWFKNNVEQFFPINNAQTVNGGSYQARGTDVRGCVGVASTTVNIIPPPVITITSNSPDDGIGSIETGDTLKVDVAEVAGSTRTYQWKYDPSTVDTNGTAITQTTRNIKFLNVLPSQSGFYKVKVTDQFGCINYNKTKVLIKPFQCKLTAQVTPTCYIATNKRWAKMQVVVQNRTLNWRGFIKVVRVKDADSVAVTGETPIIDTLWSGANTKSMTIGLRDKIPFGIYQVVMGEKRSDEESGPGFQCFPDTMKIMVDCRRKCQAPANYANCGKVPTPDLSQEIFKDSLNVGDSFFVGDFEIVVDAVTQTAPYTFKGKGYIKMPYLNFVKVQMDFDSAKINECKYLVAGAAKTVYDPNWGAIINPGQTYDDAVKLYNDIKDLTKSLIDLNFGTLDERRAKAMAKQMIASDNDLPKALVDEKNKNAAQLVDIQKKCNNGTFTPAQCTAAGDSLKKDHQALQDKIDKYKDDWVRIVTATLTEIQTTAQTNKSALLIARNLKASAIDASFDPNTDRSMEKQLPDAVILDGAESTILQPSTDTKGKALYDAEIAYNEALVQEEFSKKIKSSRSEAIALAKRLRTEGNNIKVMADYIYDELLKTPPTSDANIITYIKPIFLADIRKLLIGKMYSK